MFIPIWYFMGRHIVGNDKVIISLSLLGDLFLILWIVAVILLELGYG